MATRVTKTATKTPTKQPLKSPTKRRAKPPAKPSAKAPAKAPAKPAAKAPTKAAAPTTAVAKPQASKAGATRQAAKPVALPPAKPVEKPRKPKMVRDSFTMPKAEYAAIDTLKERAAKVGRPAKKSELLRAGVKLLESLAPAALKAALEALPAIKTGRPPANG